MAVDARPTAVGRVLAWLRAGYPQGIPSQDYVALLGVLRRRLTEHDVDSIASELAAQADKADTPVTVDDIRAMIDDQILQRASDSDIVRVSAQLAAGGWPLDFSLDGEGID